MLTSASMGKPESNGYAYCNIGKEFADLVPCDLPPQERFSSNSLSKATDYHEQGL